MAYEFIIKNGLISPGSAQITGSLTVLGGITGDLTGTASWASNAVSASWAPDQTVSVNSASWASSSISASYSEFALSASWAPQQQDISVNSITASYISASHIETVDPLHEDDVATKRYVDSLTPAGFDFYFRSSSADIVGYHNALPLTTPVSSSQTDLIVLNASASQYIYEFITPAINVVSLARGTTNFHIHMYRVGGHAANTFQVEMYIRSASVETEYVVSSPITLTTDVNANYIIPVVLTSSLETNLTDRIVGKIKIINGASTPNVHCLVEGTTAAGITVPIPSSNFVLKSGDTMTGDLTVPNVIGNLIGTASWASNAVSASWAPDQTVSVNSASWASASISSSFSTTASYTNDYQSKTATNFYFPTWFNGKLTDTSGISVENDIYHYINGNIYSLSDKPSLTVNQVDVNNVNVIRSFGDANDYVQTAVRNINAGTAASSDMVAEADNASESSSYVDVGINSSGWNSGSNGNDEQPNDSYLINHDGDLWIGTDESGSGYAIRMGIGNHVYPSMSLVVEEGGVSVSGSFYGTASYAKNSDRSISSSNANSASYIIPGATLYVVSSSTNPSYIEPYNIPTVPYNPPYKEGRMFYDKDYSNWVYYTDQNFKLHIGKEVIWRVHNPFTSSLNALTAVYLSGSTNGQDPDVYPAISDGTGIRSEVVGVIRHAIPSGSTGYVLQVGVSHNVNMTGFNIGDRVWLSTTVPGGFTNVEPGQPYESVEIGYCQVDGINGSLIVHTVINPSPPNAYAGITSDIFVTNLLNGTVGVSTGSVNLFDDATGYGLVKGYPLSATTLSLVTGSTNYIVSERTGSINAKYTLTTDPSYATGINIVRVATLDIYQETTSSWDVQIFNVGIVGLALANRTDNKDILLYGYQRQNGLTLYTTGSVGYFGITEGTVWYGPNSHVVPTFDTYIPGYYTYIFHTSGSGWHQHTSSIYLNGVYDSGAGSSSLITCAPNSWSVNFVYRLMGTNDESAIVMSNAQFATELEASNNAQPPANLPSTIRDVGLLVGRFVVQSGSYSSVVIESAFSNIFIPSVVTDHESLTGLQGGQGGEHRHLTAAEYTGTGTGVFMRNIKPVFGGATPGHVPYWKNDQTLTLTGSVQVYGDQYVLINSGSPNPTDPEALLVYQKNTSSVNTIGAYSNVNNYSQIYNQNLSSGSDASTDFCATADVGTQNSNYLDVGVANSGYASVSWPWLKPLDGYVEVDGGDMWLGLLGDKKLLFTFNNTASTNYADKTGFYLSGSFFGTASNARNSIVSVSSSFASRSFTATSASWASESFWATSSSFASESFVATSASFASQSISASYAPFTQTEQISASWASSSFVATSASFASRSISASYAPFTQTEQISASWASASFVATSASFASQSISASWAPVPVSASWASASFVATSASFASRSISASFAPQVEQISASWSSASFVATSASFASSSFVSVSSSFASRSFTATSASWASESFWATSASFASNSISSSFTTTASFAVTASFALGMPSIKSGIASGSAFAGSPKTITITFTKAFPDNNYSVTVTGESSRTYTIQSKVSGSFVINANNNTAFTNFVFWQAITGGEFYS